MATQIKPGAIIRRGAASIPPEVLRVLVENEDRVKEICDEIDARSDVFRALEQSTATKSAALEAATADLAEREAKLVEDVATLKSDRESADANHTSDMGALSRRTREVEGREKAAGERDTALDARELAIEDHGRSRETEMTAREEAVEALESAAEQREIDMAGKASDLDDRATRLATALRVVKVQLEAVSGL